MKSKKFLLSLFALLLVLSLVGFVGCKKKNNNPTENQPTEKTEQPTEVEKTYTLSFDTNGGSAVASITKKAGEAVGSVADPTLENMTFGGWYADIDLTEPTTVPEKMPSANTTLYAKWVVTLTFDTQGGPSVDPIVGDPGKVFVLPQDPVRDGYVFVGWFTDQAYTKALTFVMPKTNTTAYAKWQVFETGSAITASLKLSDNDGVYELTEISNGVRITATSAKGEWAYVASTLPCAINTNNTIVVVLKGTKDCNVTLKVEGGNAQGATETTVAMTGAEQTVIWSDVPEHFSSVGGARFLIFLNGGTAGCGATPEYVEIYSIKLFRTVDANAEQKAAIYFVSNGGSEIAAYYDVAGTKVSAPADPERPGYEFKGWFADEALTTPFEFTTIPAEGAMAYAKWEKLATIKPDIDLMTAPYAPNDAERVAVELKDGAYVFSKLATEGNEWDWFGIDFPDGAQPGGYGYLKAEFMGPAGGKLLLKVNDSKEFWFDTTGVRQSIEVQFELDYNMEKKAMIIFPNAGVAGTTEEYTIYALALANHSSKVDLIKEGWIVDEDAPTTMELSDGKLLLTKAPQEGKEWDCAKIYSDVSLVGFNKLVMAVQGTAGEQLLVKIFDSKEFWVNLDGTVQELEFEFELDYNKEKYALVLFANGGANGSGNTITITKCYFVAEGAEEQPEAKEPNGDLLLGSLDIPANNTAENYVSVKKSVGGGEWSYAGIRLDADLTGMNKLLVKILGPAGGKFLFKVNDSEEHWVDTTGELQELSFDLSLTFDAGKLPMVFFAEGGLVGTGAEYKIYQLDLSDGTNSVNLLNGEFFSGDAGVHLFEKVLKISKDDGNPNEWDCVKLTVPGDFSDYLGIEYEVQGPAGKRLLIKINDAVETWVDLTGELQTGFAPFAKAYDGSKATVVLFAEPGAAGSGAEIIFTKLFFKKADSQPIDTNEPLDMIANPGMVEVPANYSAKLVVEVSKVENGSEWSYAGIRLADTDLTGMSKLNAVILGPAGGKFLFKVNDSEEHWVDTTGELQELSFDLSLTFDNSKLAMVFFADGGLLGTGKVYTIYSLAYSNAEGTSFVNLLAGEWFSGDEGVHIINKCLVFNKDVSNTNEWDCAKLKLDVDLSKFSKLQYALKGTAGEQVIIKVNDQQETWVTLTDEEITGELEFTFTYDSGKPTLVLFNNPGKAGSGNDVIFTKLVLVPAE